MKKETHVDGKVAEVLGASDVGKISAAELAGPELPEVPATPLGLRVLETLKTGHAPLFAKLKPREQKQVESLCHAVAAFTVASAIGTDPKTLDAAGLKALGGAVHPKVRRVIFDCLSAVLGSAQNAAQAACAE